MVKTFVQELLRFDPPPDAIEQTGEPHAPRTSGRIRVSQGALALLETPLLAVPGNHDDREAMRSGFGRLHFFASTGSCRDVAGGADDRPAGLGAALAANPGVPHPPFAPGIPHSGQDRP